METKPTGRKLPKLLIKKHAEAFLARNQKSIGSDEDFEDYFELLKDFTDWMKTRAKENLEDPK